jgi:hypothetical protein
MSNELTREEAIQILYLINHYMHHKRGGCDLLAEDAIKLMKEIIEDRIISFSDCLKTLGVTDEEMDDVGIYIWGQLELIKDCRTPEPELENV